MSKIVTFGEIMLRLSPEGYYRFGQTENYRATFGGAEANVAVCLSQLGAAASFVTKLPQNDIASSCVSQLKALGVNTSDIVYGGDRLGVYYAEKGAGLRPSKVIYDRKGSSISAIGPDEIDFEKALSGADLFHFSGITPALSENCFKQTLKAVQTAKKMGIKVSCDLNYRSKLWTPEDANKAMKQLLKYTDILISNEEDCTTVFGLKAGNSDVNSGRLDLEGYRLLSRKLYSTFPLSHVAFTLRGSLSASLNTWQGILSDKQGCYLSREYTIQIVDRVGSGDAFAAGLLYGLTDSKYSAQEALEIAAACGAIKHSVEGDFNRTTLPEVLSLAKGNASGRVIR